MSIPKRFSNEWWDQVCPETIFDPARKYTDHCLVIGTIGVRAAVMRALKLEANRVSEEMKEADNPLYERED